MLLVPEISTVVILPPRTGSSSLRKALLARYSMAMQVYRHMEADGIPLGYDTWRRVGIVRNPIDRLWSLYKFLGDFGGGQHDPAFVKTMRQSVERPFSEWLLENEVTFTSPYDRAGFGRFWPAYSVRHPMPENRKSQAVYIRPDLGTEFWDFSNIDAMAESLGVVLHLRENQTQDENKPSITPEAMGYLMRVHSWDFSVTSPAIAAE
ncbi:hypothetical protein RA27_02060 [Ruegeria sp. ANG-R]|uniref:hypothetical protein n=1 Tax=Ruegeria sp. ANG-R TaxID=1577903 RepID=UPI00057F8CB9|nr:hypothetical protein [Ruegeria sp. ANG-R]KIC42202.1 hypothetical protein RA27_02060 [Ruegeria sp. ANG-R]